MQLSLHKFASNVIEKCLEYGGRVERDLIIKEIAGPDESYNSLLVRPYGPNLIHFLLELIRLDINCNPPLTDDDEGPVWKLCGAEDIRDMYG